MKRRQQVRGITLPARPRRRARDGRMPAVCAECMEPITLGAVQVTITAGDVYRHGCGRVLYDPAYGTMEPML